MERRTFSVPLPDGRTLALGERTLVMGIINVTPDSFADGGRHLDPARAIEAGLAMVAQGADILDVGGESTRPGAVAVPADEERRRILPVVQGLVRQTPVPVSIDTYKAAVAADALDAGALIVNDISGLARDPALGRVAAERRAGVILMHTRGCSADMYAHAAYADVIDDVARELGEALARADAAGIAREATILDPGIGFAKRAAESLTLLARPDAAPLQALGRPFLIGPSRKSFLRVALGDEPPDGRDWGTAAAVTAAVLGGAHIVRVHNVAAMAQVSRVADQILAAR